MPFRIHRSKAGLGTCYIEICPGKYSGKHWQDGCVFIEEEEFLVAEGIIGKHFAEFDHFGPNDLPKDLGRTISAEWRTIASQLPQLNGRDIIEALSLNGTLMLARADLVAANGTDIARMLIELADACDQFYEREDWICILGL